MVMKIRKSFTQYFFVSIFVTSFLFACSTNRETAQPQTDKTPIQVEPTVLVTATVKADVTVTQKVAPSPIPATATPIPTETPLLPINMQCLEISPALPETSSLSGVIFLWLSRNSTSSPVMINMETGLFTEYPELAEVATFRQSPDHKWLAFHDRATSKLILLDASGEQKEITNWDARWFDIANWPNNETLAIVLHGERTGKTMPPQGAYNIVSDEYQEFNRDYPDIYYLAETDYQWVTSTLYDPSLSRVVYIATDLTGTPQLELRLLDLQTQKTIAELGPWEYAKELGKWSPDGSSFITVLAVLEQGSSEWHHEFFNIRYDDRIEQVTHFNEYYDEFRIGNYSWSPNGRYLAVCRRDTHFYNKNSPIGPKI